MNKQKLEDPMIEKWLRESTPPPTAVPPPFRYQLRQQLLTQAAAPSRSGWQRAGWLKTAVPVLLLLLVGLGWWVSQTAVFAPAAEPRLTTSLTSKERAIATALAYAQQSNKPVNGRLLMPPMSITAVSETYDGGIDRLGTHAIAVHGGSNIIFNESRTDAIWFVQVRGQWRSFGDETLSIRTFGAMVSPDGQTLLAAGSTTAIFLEDVLMLPLAEYPPADTPYRLEPSGIWLVNLDGDIRAYLPQTPAADPAQVCEYVWSVAVDRFVDPCSGDEWRLDGTLDLAASPERWSNRHLDQVRLTVAEDQAFLFLSDRLQGETVDE